MSIDLNKLAMWTAWKLQQTASVGGKLVGGIVPSPLIEGDHCVYFDPDFAEFVAIARAAFDVMMRRKWEPQAWLEGGQSSWGVDSSEKEMPYDLCDMRWPDPFTALVEADKWYKENVEEGQDEGRDLSKDISS